MLGLRSLGLSTIASIPRSRAYSCAAAQEYARERGIEAIVLKPKDRKPNIRARGYGENFATDRRGAWTH